MSYTVRRRIAALEVQLAETRRVIGDLRAATLVRQALADEFGADYAYAATAPAVEMPVRLAQIIPFPRQATHQ